jgi:hypothetical protein
MDGLGTSARTNGTSPLAGSARNGRVVGKHRICPRSGRMQGKTGSNSATGQWLVLPNKPHRSSPLLVSRGEKCERAFHQASPFCWRQHGRHTAGATGKRSAPNRLFTDRADRRSIARCPCDRAASRHADARCGNEISGSTQCPHCNLPKAIA